MSYPWSQPTHPCPIHWKNTRLVTKVVTNMWDYQCCMQLVISVVGCSALTMHSPGLSTPPRPSPKKRRWGIPVEARVRKYPPAQSTHSQVPGDASIRRQWVLTDGPRPPGAARHVGCAWLNRATRAGWRRTAARPRCRRRGALQWEPATGCRLIAPHTPYEPLYCTMNYPGVPDGGVLKPSYSS